MQPQLWRFQSKGDARWAERHYYLRLLQVGALLLKNHGEYPRTLSSILSGEGLDESEQG
jgi:hypothetical protein